VTSITGFIYEICFSRFSPFHVNGLTTFYHCTNDLTDQCLGRYVFCALTTHQIETVICAWCTFVLGGVLLKIEAGIQEKRGAEQRAPKAQVSRRREGGVLGKGCPPPQPTRGSGRAS